MPKIKFDLELNKTFSISPGNKSIEFPALEITSIKFPAQREHRKNSIEFSVQKVPTRNTRAYTNSNQNFHAWLPLQLIRRYLFNAPGPWIDLPKEHQLSKEITTENEVDQIYLTNQDLPYNLTMDDDYIIYPTPKFNNEASHWVFTAYKRVDKKIHPVSMQLPPDCEVIRHIPENPLLTLPYLTNQPPDFAPTAKITWERMKELNVNATGFLWPEEKLFQHVMKLNEQGIAFEDVEH